jgi:hypothetical protein
VLGANYRADDERLWASVTLEVNAVLSSPTVGGALASLLGPDLIAPPGNSLMHVAQPTDQTFHRDGTDHGPTMSTVRDHRCRHVIVMFYPVETTVDLGPTTILPRSQYTGVNREGFHNSEERLSPFLRPPTGAAAHQPTMAWQSASEKDAAFTAAQSLEEQDASRIAHAIEMLGDPTLAELKVTVPAVSCSHRLSVARRDCSNISDGLSLDCAAPAGRGGDLPHRFVAPGVAPDGRGRLAADVRRPLGGSRLGSRGANRAALAAVAAGEYVIKCRFLSKRTQRYIQLQLFFFKCPFR